MADRHTIYKHAAKEIAALNQVALTFMAKWRADLAGSSFHLHSSLWDRDGRRNLFGEEGAGPHGMSPVFRHYLAGQLAGARELERSEIAREAFGDRVVEHYLHTARLEQQAFDRAVTCWELARNFERI